MSSLLLWWSCASADYTDREVSRAVESLVTRNARIDRKPTLEKLKSVLPRAIERFAWNQAAMKILNQIEKTVDEKLTICVWSAPSQDLAKFDLQTDTSIRSIDLDDILSGWPGKDGIPALTDPAFMTIYDAQEAGFLSDESEWIIVQDGSTAKFYPYNILNRHEIVNDTVGEQHVAITFCPLCGTAIVFDREFDGKVVEFGVSGLLYNSNLLMYDNVSESLRSQAVGKAVVGFYTDKQLEYVDSDVQSFAAFAAQYPDGVVLSNNTWFSRNYGLNSPYGDYDSNDDLYFPVSNSDSSLPKKTLLYVVNDNDYFRSVAFIKEELIDAWSATIDADGVTYTASYDDGTVNVMRNGTEISNFVQMRFSWTAHENHPRFLRGLEGY